MGMPDASVLSAFGLRGTPVALAGGAGHSVRVGDAVLKPVGDDPEAADWRAGVMESVVEDGFRVARPLRTMDGLGSSNGWTATSYLEGAEPRHDAAPRWPDIIDAGRAFHRAIAHVPCPTYLAQRSDPWAVGDRVAWGEAHVEIVPELCETYSVLTSLTSETPDSGAQLIHGDLTGNVLFAEGQPPAIIDFSPYWRRPAFGEAIVVGDAMLWHGADLTLLDHVDADASGLAPYMVRALIFRLVVTSEFIKHDNRGDGSWVAVEVANYKQVARSLAQVVHS
jgi:uncharacterized protein (TIGR02569 family)